MDVDSNETILWGIPARNVGRMSGALLVVWKRRNMGGYEEEGGS